MGKGTPWKKTIQFQTVINGKKKCSKCLIWRSLKMFRKVQGKRPSWHSGVKTKCIPCYTACARVKSRELRQEFIDAYGGKCSCCGINEVEFLTVEHIGGRSKFNGERGGMNDKGGGMCKWLKLNGWPKKGFTVLCWNCNCARRYGRPCPHESRHKKWLVDILYLAEKSS